MIKHRKKGAQTNATEGGKTQLENDTNHPQYGHQKLYLVFSHQPEQKSTY